MALLTVLPPRKEKVTQSMLELYQLAEACTWDACKRRDKLADAIYRLLASGAEVECGVRTLEIKEKVKGGKLVRSLRVR